MNLRHSAGAGCPDESSIGFRWETPGHRRGNTNDRGTEWPRALERAARRISANGPKGARDMYARPSTGVDESS